MSLIESLSIVEKFAHKLEKTEGHVKKIVKENFVHIIENNSGFINTKNNQRYFIIGKSTRIHGN